mgnify:CR=1 FL=1
MRSEARGEAVRSEEEEVGRGACVVGPRCPVRDVVSLLFRLYSYGPTVVNQHAHHVYIISLYSVIAGPTSGTS